MTRYMPDDIFETYLHQFREDLLEPRNSYWLDQSLSEMEEQISKRILNRNIAEDISKLRGNPLRFAIASSSTLSDAASYPDLVTALMIYHAAHASYFEELAHAIERSPLLTDEERLNGVETTMQGDLAINAKSFLLFQSLLPLIMHQYGEQPHDPQALGKFSALHSHSRINPEAMKTAIGEAWDVFFDREVLQHRYRADGITTMEDVDTDRVMLCPAHAHLKAAKDHRVLEGLYDFVLQNPKLAQRAMVQERMNAI